MGLLAARSFRNDGDTLALLAQRLGVNRTRSDRNEARSNIVAVCNGSGGSQTTIPRQTQPPACTAAVIVGSRRQSMNRHSGVPGFATREH
jgi:hypothetical protein